ncbi:MAG: hypothetical protein ACERLG_08520 [Sedimentibacter sp.]
MWANSRIATSDINAGKIITEGSTIDDIGMEFFNKIIEVSNGKLTKAKSLGHNAFRVCRI